MFAIRMTTKWLAATLFFSFAMLSMPSTASDWEPNPTGNSRRMIVPLPIPVPEGRSIEEVKDAIYKSINGRRWTGKEIAPNVIEATFDQKGNGKRILVVDLKYDARQVEMTYKHSTALRYEVVNGEALLHNRANGWMKNLASDIRRFMDQ